MPNTFNQNIDESSSNQTLKSASERIPVNKLLQILPNNNIRYAICKFTCNWFSSIPEQPVEADYEFEKYKQFSAA